ncbi:hypothetical protein HNR26_004600 [Rhizobium rosettiformans]|uniref:Glycosyltransferase family 2 protein n=2 Tax=Rhizobium rosettiformans TaxID=1368430 RepID=A0A4S8PSE8_9HYPH|nr:glycosyltransferase [Rhizobium rosettiformans]MBB5278499.1 hypothetical protein [Rhizobium rosettiformans]THV31084.1 glycosyltransferase family 2 protein [Rhizobium rosettiformans W3]
MSSSDKAARDVAEHLLTVSIVTFQPDMEILRRTLESLVAALTGFEHNLVKVFVIQNSDSNAVPLAVARILANYHFEIITGHGNIGFGAAHNLILPKTGRFHLILNPDIEMDPAALINAIHFMSNNRECGLVTPKAHWPDGQRQYLCKNYPALFDLLLRGFAPALLKQIFAKRLDRYEMRTETADSDFWDPPIVSGCFMFFDGDILRRLNGFDPSYFLYFEDFDLSLRTSQITRIVYVPKVKVIHAGGHAAKKGMKHIRLFAKSARTFYRRHGLRLV